MIRRVVVHMEQLRKLQQIFRLILYSILKFRHVLFDVMGEYRLVLLKAIFCSEKILISNTLIEIDFN